MSQMEAVARQLQDENRRIKARVNDQEERLKRLATQVKKEEEAVAAQSKKAGVRPEQIKDLPAKDAKIRKLQQQVREREKQNTALDRHLAVYRHSFPHQQTNVKAAHQRRPLWEAANRSPQQQPGSTSPTVAKGGRKSKEGALMLGADEDDQQRLVLVLEGELERARETLTRLRAELVVASKQGKVAVDFASASSSAESVDQLKRRLKEMTARLTILLSSQERTQTAFKEEQEQHSTLVNEVESLDKMMSDIRQTTAKLSHDKQIMQLRKGETDDLSKQIAETQKELEQLDADNRSLRDRAFKTGGFKVAVRVTEDEKRIKEEENASLKEAQARLRTQLEKLQKDVDEAEKGQQGSVHSMQQSLTNLNEQAQHLQKETERLREQMLSVSGQQERGHLAPATARGSLSLKRDQDKGKEVRRLRRENAQHVREIRKGEQELQLHKLLVKENDALEADLSKHIDALCKSHKSKTAVLQRKLTVIEINNERLRNQLHELQLGKQAGGKPAAAVAAGAVVTGPQSRVAAAGTTRTVVEICVEGLVLDKTHRALQGAEEPRTMMLLDFFMHDTQYSTPMVGLAPRGRLERSFETVVDQLLMHYLYTDSLRIQIVRIIGLDVEPLGECKVPLAKFVDMPTAESSLVLHRVEIAGSEAGILGVAQPVGVLNVSIKILTSIKEAARIFLEHAPKPTAGVAPAQPVDRESLLQLQPEMVRRVGTTYTLRVNVKSVSGARSKLPVVAMFQLLDTDVCASDTVTTSVDGTAALVGGKCVLQLEATQELDKRLLSQAMDVCLFDDTDASSQNGLLGVGHVLLAPLLHRRGVSGTVQLRSPDEHKTGVVASVSVDLSWDPEPLDGTAAAASVGAAPVSSGAVAWEVRSALWKIKNWAQTLGFGPGVKAFQVVYEALMDAALQSGLPHAEGLTARMWQVGLTKEGSQLALSQGLMDSTHAHLAGGSAVISKEAFISALVASRDPGPPPAGTAAPTAAGSAQAMEQIVPEPGEVSEESAVMLPSGRK